jgi:hypothetical protein
VNLLGDNIGTIKKNTEILTDVSKEVGLEINVEKSKYHIFSNLIRTSLLPPCIGRTARTPALSFGQTPALDHESNPHLILIRIRIFSPLQL